MPRLPFNVSFPARQQVFVSDKELIAACLKGEKGAWDTLISRYAALIYSTCRRLDLSAADTEDVVQDVCIILLDHLADLRDVAKLSSWLISTTKREVWRYQRRKGIKLASELGESEWALDSAEGIHTPMAESPETEFLAIEEQQLVRQGMEKLQDRCRHLLKRLYGTDDPPSYADLADELSLPVGSIGPTRARCLQQLRKMLAELGF